MKFRGKRWISIILIAVLLIPAVPVPVRAAKGDKLVALTFDDGPHRTYTARLLEGLRERDVNVTFFMLGQNAASNRSLIETAYYDGHEIGNHSYDHPNLNTLSANGVRNQVNATASILDAVCGSGTEYLVRPPYGNANSTVLSALGSPAILWSVDTNDWQYKDANHVHNHIVSHASDGAIILCHDIYSSTVAGALSAVDSLLARGYEFVTVSELYRRRGVAMPDGTKLYSCKNNGVDLGPVQKPVITYEAIPGAVRVDISSPSGAPVYYTINREKFNQQSKRYTGSLIVQDPVEVQAMAAFDLNGDRSDVALTRIYVVKSAAPKIRIENGTLQIHSDTATAPIYYSTDNTAPVSFKRYTEPVWVEPGTTVRAYAGGGDHTLTNTMIMHYSENKNVFADVFPGDWYYKYMDKMAAEGILSGVREYVYAPTSETTRAMLLVMLYRLSQESLGAGWERTNTFTDIQDGCWYSEAVEWGYRNDIIIGYSDNTFRPDRPITREEMAKVIAYYMKDRDYELDFETDHRDRFTDGAYIQIFAIDAVNALVSKGLLTGGADGAFHPAKTAARAEVAAVIARMME